MSFSDCPAVQIVQLRLPCLNSPPQIALPKLHCQAVLPKLSCPKMASPNQPGQLVLSRLSCPPVSSVLGRVCVLLTESLFWGAGSCVLCAVSWVLCLGSWVLGPGFHVLGPGFWVLGCVLGPGPVFCVLCSGSLDPVSWLLNSGDCALGPGS